MGKGGGSSGGGGGSSGKVSWPSYLQTAQSGLFDDGGDTDFDDGVSAIDALNAAWRNSPYASAYGYDPSSDLDSTQTKVDTYDAFVATLTTDLYPTYYDTVVGKINSSYGTDYVTAMVNAQATQMVRPTMRAIARMSAGARDINATMGSSYIMATALIEQAALQDLSAFAAKANMEFNTQRFGMINAGISSLIQLLQLEGQGKQSVAQLQAEANRIRIVAQKEFIDGDVELSVKDAMWQLELLQPVANVLASIQGGTVAPVASSKDRSSTSMLGGALGGAASFGLLAATGGASAPLTIGAALLGGGASFLG